jgi:mannose-1-phosphate guanylyltransferase
MEIFRGGLDRDRWGLILAGGQGLRLRPLTRAITGDERPKQFCPVLGFETLLEGTRRRAALSIAPARLLLSLTQGHERFYRPLLRGMPAHCAVVQPEDRGTAPAILYGALRIAALAPLGTVAILPSDHYVDDDRRFMKHVDEAFAAAEARPDLVVLLGLSPQNAEVEYGWIEPGEPIPGTPLHRVSRFWEKPSAGVAEALLARGCLWNSFVLVARVATLLALVRQAAPALDAVFAPARAALGTGFEASEIRKVYERIPPSSFSDVVLASCPPNLAVLPVRGVQWSDWGQPARVLATLSGLGLHPDWLDRFATTA